LKYRHWTVDDWKRVVWSDETKVCLQGSDGLEWAWTEPGSGLTDRNVKGTVKFGGKSLMMWGCMTSQGIGYATHIKDRMDGEFYADILNDEFLQSLAYYGLEVDEIIFQQDNDSKHTSSPARRWFERNKVKVLDWPSRSPDLNPIEHLWRHLKRQLAAYETEVTEIDELWERVEIEWEKIPKQVCIDLIESMPRRIAAVLKAKGGYTKY
jgi:hypothetical protein